MGKNVAELGGVPMSKPRPVLDAVPERERVMYCLRCMVEQPIQVLDSELNQQGIWVAPVQCKVCGTIVSRLIHHAGQGWTLDTSFYRERSGAGA